MKRDCSRFAFAQGMTVFEVPETEYPEYVPAQSDIDRVLQDIFSVDERTGFPKGDIAYYLSPDGNPAVKDWLMNNLLKPRSVAIGSSVEGVTDDLIAEMSRESGESVDSYAARLQGYYQDAQAEYQKFLDSKKTE